MLGKNKLWWYPQQQYPYAMLNCLTKLVFFCAAALPMWTMRPPASVQSQGCSCQGCRAETFWNRPLTFRNLPPGPTPPHAGTCRNSSILNLPPEPASRTYTSTRWNPPQPARTCLRNLHHHTPELSKTCRNQPSRTFRNLSGTYGTLGNLPVPTFRNLSPERTFPNFPEPASGTHTNTHAVTVRNLPEPSSGTCSCDAHRHRPELIWAEDAISLRCWGKKTKQPGQRDCHNPDNINPTN